MPAAGHLPASTAGEQQRRIVILGHLTFDDSGQRRDLLLFLLAVEDAVCYNQHEVIAVKRLLSIVLLVCCMLSCGMFGYAEDSNPMQMISGQGMNAYLVTEADKTYLFGCIDYDTLVGAQPEVLVDYVVQYCEHEEHIAAKQALATQLSAAVVTTVDLPAAFLGDGAIVCGEYAFSADKKSVEQQTMDCLGNYLKFAASTNEASVNVRATPTTKGQRVEKLKRGETLTVLGQVVNDKGEIWYQVELADGKQGYIRSDLLETADAVPETKETAEKECKKESRYIGNKKTKVFHRPSCGHLPSSKNIVYFSSRSYAVTKGYKPCSICDP